MAHQTRGKRREGAKGRELMGRHIVNQGSIIPIPGKPGYGYRWDGYGWALYRPVHRRDGGVEYGRPVYPVNFRHFCTLIAHEVGIDTDGLADLLDALVSERERLEEVLYQLVQTTAPAALEGVASKDRYRMEVLMA